MPTELPRKEIPLAAYTLEISDVRKIFERLSGHVNNQADREIGELVKPDDREEEEWERVISEERKRAFRITVTIRGTGGSELYGDDVQIFSSPNLPDRIEYIYMTNVVAYRGVANREPANSFALQLDFSKPSLVDSSNVIMGPTPNNSRLWINGDNEAWVATIDDAVNGVLKERKNKREFIHRGHIYDLGVVIIGVPFALYVEFQMLAFIKARFGELHDILIVGVFIYVFFACLWIYRVLFSYTKWAFPSLEMVSVSDTAPKHRKFWYVIATGLVVNFVASLFGRGIFP